MVARPLLFKRLDGSARVTVLSAPPGSGKSVLVRSWVGEARLAPHTAWVSGALDGRDPQRFWLSVRCALRQTTPGAALVQSLAPAPDTGGWAIAERLLAELAPLDDQLWLVIDDVHELVPEALRQLELLVLRGPSELRFVLASRHDVRLGLHRLRLEGQVAEIRAPELAFSLDEARELFAAAGLTELPQTAVALLHKRTEGWAAGLRLAALSLAGHPDPERFAADFSGTERTVAEYLLAEVLDRQDEPVRRLLLNTSIVERVNGELADLLSGGSGGERVLQDLEQAGAFTVSVDPSRTWFRYHQMFSELLRLELRRAAPDQVDMLHRMAAGWFAEHETELAEQELAFDDRDCAEILSLLGQRQRVPPPARQRSLAEPLSDSETRVLRYLPTNLTAPEIARELSVSPHTIKSHMRNLYAKLRVHRRTEAVARARELGLLAPGTLRR